MKIIKKIRAKHGDGVIYRVQEKSTGLVYDSFLTREGAQFYIDHTDGVLKKPRAKGGA